MPKSSFAFVEDTFDSFRSHHIVVKVADSPWEQKAYFTLRQQVFSKEQKILPDNEKDSQDFRAIPIVAVASSWGVNDSVVGAVRIYTVGNDVWFGGRLCVARAYRGFREIGKALINEAVSRAIDLGCQQFLANVQMQNENYFQRLYWKTVEYIEVENRPHARMEALLEHYPFMRRHRS
ncbi:MAG: GNAT family N-acetyltransferase [Gammaproteobacteria bacterium]|jgi:putative N-acetyltransferase (TIGR04045 family)